MKYLITIEGGELGETHIEATDLEQAEELARDWVLDGDWSKCERAELVTCSIEAEDGEEFVFEQAVGGPAEPPCEDVQEHDWQSPHELVGGCQNNPGVFGRGNAQLRFEEVCSNCGRYRTTITASVPGQAPPAPERATYREPDDESLAWVAQNTE